MTLRMLPVRMLALVPCVVGFGPALAAQVSQISGSGCAGAGRVAFGGPPGLGKTVFAVLLVRQP